MWLFKIPGNKISTQQLSNGHAPHSVKLKPFTAWAGHRPLHTSSLGLCCEVPRGRVEEDGLLGFRGVSIFWLPTEGSVAYLQKPHSGCQTRPPKCSPSSLPPHSRTRSITNSSNQSNCPTKIGLPSKLITASSPRSCCKGLPRNCQAFFPSIPQAHVAEDRSWEVTWMA